MSKLIDGRAVRTGQIVGSINVHRTLDAARLTGGAGAMIAGRIGSEPIDVGTDGQALRQMSAGRIAQRADASSIDLEPIGIRPQPADRGLHVFERGRKWEGQEQNDTARLRPRTRAGPVLRTSPANDPDRHRPNHHHECKPPPGPGHRSCLGRARLSLRC